MGVQPKNPWLLRKVSEKLPGPSKGSEMSWSEHESWCSGKFPRVGKMTSLASIHHSYLYCLQPYYMDVQKSVKLIFDSARHFRKILSTENGSKLSVVVTVGELCSWWEN
jgi:hypothetical protein